MCAIQLDPDAAVRVLSIWVYNQVSVRANTSVGDISLEAARDSPEQKRAQRQQEQPEFYWKLRIHKQENGENARGTQISHSLPDDINQRPHPRAVSIGKTGIRHFRAEAEKRVPQRIFSGAQKGEWPKSGSESEQAAGDANNRGVQMNKGQNQFLLEHTAHDDLGEEST
jgi:hypothetical protein